MQPISFLFGPNASEFWVLIEYYWVGLTFHYQNFKTSFFGLNKKTTKRGFEAQIHTVVKQ